MMPELPEVETYARDLEGILLGRELRGAVVTWPNQLPRNDPAGLARRVTGQRFRTVGRRGKYLVFRLTEDWLLVHLKMSGRLRVEAASTPRGGHVHVVFPLDRGEELRFVDPRKFGRVYLLTDPSPILGSLGPEPLDPRLDEATFARMLQSRRGRLKPLLTNQQFLAGLGNIYVDEALWEARLHPLMTADRLSRLEADRLLSAIRRVLTRGIEARGTTLSDGGFRDLQGRPGQMAPSLAVFGRTGSPCPRCKGPVERIVVGQRGTHFCPGCQPSP
jgi:formamidopyrimidine-DNA glycosylase